MEVTETNKAFIERFIATDHHQRVVAGFENPYVPVDTNLIDALLPLAHWPETRLRRLQMKALVEIIFLVAALPDAGAVSILNDKEP